MGTDNGNTGSALYKGVLACVSIIRNVIRNKRCFWSSISSHEMKGFEFVSLLADGEFQPHCSFLSLVTKSLFFEFVFQTNNNSAFLFCSQPRIHGYIFKYSYVPDCLLHVSGFILWFLPTISRVGCLPIYDIKH